MRKLFDWIAALRLSVTIPSGLLAAIGCKLAGKPINWPLAAWVSLLAMLAMLHNDYVDRIHDQRKNRTFALENEHLLKRVLIGGWSIMTAGSILAFAPYASILFPVILICILYSYCRQIPFVQTVCVAFASASPILMTADHISVFGQISNSSLFFFAVFIAICGRETVKDIEDNRIDMGYKATVISSGLLTVKRAYTEAGGFILIGQSVLVLGMSPYISSMGSWLQSCTYLGVGFCLASAMYLIFWNDMKLGKRFFDVGMLLIVAALLIK